ncbi:MAG: hypothetical protein M3169_01920 [Candidatus Eremiobacteraeota bacterium]|nr:hypothetical protein [Candidatus Eremiobacteraeota bacterium]
MSEPIEVKPMWRRAGGLALVCEKCLNVRFPEDFPEHAGDERLKLREWLKDRLKAQGHWGVVRAVGTTCLDVCAVGRVTVLLDPMGRGGEQRCLVFDPLEDRELIYQTILRELAPTVPVPHEAETEKTPH